MGRDSMEPTTGTPAANHPRRFDRSTYNQLTGLDARFLELMDYDCRQQASKSPTGARYSVKPEAWFAQCLGVCRETISHVVTKLAHIGLLEITHRKPVRGIFQTNLYKIRSWVWWRLGKVLRSLRKVSHRVKEGSHLSNPMRVKKPEPRANGAPTAIKSTLGELFARVQRGEIISET
jgi:hypothetical protein